MKPTELQKKVIDSVISIMETWKNSNDITSPTHFNDIHEFLNADLGDYLIDDYLEEMEFPIRDMFYTIKDLTKNKPMKNSWVKEKAKDIK